MKTQVLPCDHTWIIEGIGDSFYVEKYEGYAEDTRKAKFVVYWKDHIKNICNQIKKSGGHIRLVR